MSLLILVAAVPLALWLRSKGVGRPSPPAGSRAVTPAELVPLEWKSDPAALAAAQLPDPSKATLGLDARDANGARVGVRSIMPWIAGEGDDDITATIASVLVAELDHRVTDLPQLYNALDRGWICSASYESDYDKADPNADRTAGLLTARRLGQDCVLLGHITGDADAVTLRAELLDVGIEGPVGEPWTLSGTPEELCARDGELLLEALRLAQVSLEPAQERWLQQPLTTSEDAFSLALALEQVWEQGDGDDLLAGARKMVEVAPDFPLSYGYLYGAERTHGACRAALPAIRKAVAGKDVRPRQLLAGLLVATACGEWAWGIEMIERHEAAQPRSFLRSMRALDHYASIGDGKNTLTYARQLVALNPRSSLAWRTLGRNMSSWWDPKRAAAALTVALELDSQNHSNLSDALWCFARMGDDEKANELFAYAQQLFPADASFHRPLIRLRAYGPGFESDASPFGVMKWMAKTAAEKPSDRVKKLVDEAARLPVETPAEHFALGQLLCAYRRRSEGIGHIRTAIRDAESAYWPGAHEILATALSQKDAYTEATDAAVVALRQRYSSRAHWVLVDALIHRGRYREALREGKSLAQHYPNLSSCRRLYARALFKSKDYDRAIDEYEVAYELDDWNMVAGMELARTATVVGRHDRAKKVLYEIEERYGKGGYKSVFWGNCFLAAGEYEHALEWFERAAKETPGEAAVQMNSGYCYLCMGDYKTARAIWERFGGPYRNDPEYALGMAICDLAAGDKASAVKGYLKVKKSDPDFLDEENLRYRYWPPRCFEWLDKIEELAAQQEEQPAAQ
ncbi:MAG: tetratricopeptide repeat protein [Armatimonadota bacterium]